MISCRHISNERTSAGTVIGTVVVPKRLHKQLQFQHRRQQIQQQPIMLYWNIHTKLSLTVTTIHFGMLLLIQLVSFSTIVVSFHFGSTNGRILKNHAIIALSNPSFLQRHKTTTTPITTSKTAPTKHYYSTQSQKCIILLQLHGRVLNNRYQVNDEEVNDDYNYGSTNDNDNYYHYLGTCIPGLASVLANEIQQIIRSTTKTTTTTTTEFDNSDANVKIVSNSAVTFRISKFVQLSNHGKNSSDDDNNDDYHLTTILRILLWCRTAHKILQLLCTTQQHGDHDQHSNDDNSLLHERNDLYEYVRTNINVQDIIGNGIGGLLTFAVSVTLNNPKYIPTDINHSHYTALTIKNAIVDEVRILRTTSGTGNSISDTEQRPNIDIIDPDVPIHAIVLGVNTNPTNGNWDTNNRGRYNSYNRNNNNNNKYGGYRNSNNNNNNNNRGSTSIFTNSNNNNNVISAGAHISIYRQIHTMGSLHRRGYRNDDNLAIHKAAMKETLASGLLLYTKWDTICQSIILNHSKGSQQNNHVISHPTAAVTQESIVPGTSTSVQLVDPMCGSGTILIEGAMIAADIAPGLMRIKCNVNGSREPPILRWKHYRYHIDTADNDMDSENIVVTKKQYITNEINTIWKELLIDATDRAKQGLQLLTDNKNLIQIIGNDQHSSALYIANRCIQNAGLMKIIQISSTDNPKDCKEWYPFTNNSDTISPIISNSPQTVVVCNPPWGVRLNSNNNNNNNGRGRQPIRQYDNSYDNGVDNIVSLQNDEIQQSQQQQQNNGIEVDNDLSTRDAWESLRIFLREICPPFTNVWILSGNKQRTKHLGLARTQSIPIHTADQDLRYLQYIIRNKTHTITSTDENDNYNNYSNKREYTNQDDKISTSDAAIRIKRSNVDIPQDIAFDKNSVRIVSPVFNNADDDNNVRVFRPTTGSQRSVSSLLEQQNDSPTQYDQRRTYSNNDESRNEKARSDNNRNTRNKQRSTGSTDKQQPSSNSRSNTNVQKKQRSENEWLL